MALAAATVARGATVVPQLIHGRPTEVLAAATPPDPAALDQLRPMMRAVVTDGTAKLLGRRGEVFGKTGTAEYTDDGRAHGWFVGYRGDLAFAVLDRGRRHVGARPCRWPTGSSPPWGDPSGTSLLRVPRSRIPALAITADIVSVIVFAAVGRASHDESADISGCSPRPRRSASASLAAWATPLVRARPAGLRAGLVVLAGTAAHRASGAAGVPRPAAAVLRGRRHLRARRAAAGLARAGRGRRPPGGPRRVR